LSELVAVSDQGDDAGLHGAIGLAAEALADKKSAGAGDGANPASLSDDGDHGTTMMKRAAFGHGFWHGMLVGGVGTALLFRYAVLPILFASWEDRRSTSSRRRTGGSWGW
jgi:hypothetical protein